MLLDEATSKEQVEAALEAGDDELREDIEEILDDVKRRWDRGPNYDDSEPIDMKEIVEREDFVDKVIERSPDNYDLSQIPREDVESALRRAVRRVRPPVSSARCPTEPSIEQATIEQAAREQAQDEPPQVE